MVRDVRYSEFQAFVDEKGLERPCVECGTNDWQMLSSSEDIEAEKDAPMFLGSLPEISKEDWPPNRAFSSYIMFCAGCGVIKLVSANVIWAWLEKRGG
jgi:hypothetical protein